MERVRGNVRITIKFGSFSMLIYVFFCSFNIPAKRVNRKEQSFNDLKQWNSCYESHVDVIRRTHRMSNSHWKSYLIVECVDAVVVEATENDHMENEQRKRRKCVLLWVNFRLSEAFWAFSCLKGHDEKCVIFTTVSFGALLFDWWFIRYINNHLSLR